MRTFFAVTIPDDTKLAIQRWQEIALRLDARIIPPANFHITLQFNGNTSEQQLEQIAKSNISFPELSLTCNEIGYFSKPKVGFLLVNDNTELEKLATDCKNIAKKVSLPTADNKYVPHISLYRKLKLPPPAPLIAPSFHFKSRQIALYESKSTNSGVQYQPIIKWDAINSC